MAKLLGYWLFFCGLVVRVSPEKQVRFLKRRVARPQGFNEKILHRAAWDRRPFLQQTGDKWSLREYVSARVGESYLPNLFWVGRKVPLDRPSGIPGEFVAKVSHRSGGVVVVADSTDISPRSKEAFSSGPNRYLVRPDDVSWADLADSMNTWLSMSYAWGGSICAVPEWSYQGFDRFAIIEELLRPKDEPLRDFKFFVFCGEIKLIRVDTPTGSKKTMSHFLPDWTELEVRFWEPGQLYGRTLPAPEKPPNFGEAEEVVSFLARDFDFVRVDTYLIDGRLLIGEMTHYPTAGRGHFSDPNIDLWLGSQWSLPSFHTEQRPSSDPPRPHSAPQGSETCRGGPHQIDPKE